MSCSWKVSSTRPWPVSEDSASSATAEAKAARSRMIVGVRPRRCPATHPRSRDGPRSTDCCTGASALTPGEDGRPWSGPAARTRRWGVRREASILHLDLDAFFAAVEQRDKPSLRGRPVVVGGVGGRGVVATASYEARAYGARSAMSTAEARRRCPPGTAFLGGRFAAYRRTSDVVMSLLRELSPLVEPASLDEAYVDLAAGEGHDLSVDGVTEIGRRLKDRIAAATGGVTGSVGIGSSKLMAKIGSDLQKPDGLVVAPPGRGLEVLPPLPVTRLGGAGPATAERLHQIGVKTVGDLAAK